MKLKDNAAHRKLELLKGYEGVWISARRNNVAYALNKILSFSVSIIFALVTLYLKYASIDMFVQQNKDETKAESS